MTGIRMRALRHAWWARTAALISVHPWCRYMVDELWRMLVMATLLFAGAAWSAPMYVATPLGTLGGYASVGNAINAHGDVAGTAPPSTSGAGYAHAFRYSDGEMHDLGTLGTGLNSYGIAINSSGEIAGYAEPAYSDNWKFPLWHGFVTANGALRDIGSLGDDAGATQAYGINDKGQVTGRSSGPGFAHAFLYSNGQMIDIDPTGSREGSFGYAINSTGEVTGVALSGGFGADQRAHAFLYSNGRMVDIGTLGGVNSLGLALNDSGEVTGSSDLASVVSQHITVTHAFLYSGGTMRDIHGGAFVGSSGLAINAAGQVVGRAYTAFDPSGNRTSPHGFIYTDGEMYDLNALVVSGLGSATLTEATGINDAGQIVGNACGSIIWVCQAFRLDPVEPNPRMPDPVPVVEYYFPPFNHYFMTASPTDIAALDEGRFPGWVRTGYSFKAYDVQAIGADPVCRFYNDSFTPMSSHFYSADANECVFVKANTSWAWQFEGISMYIPTPRSGVCPADTQPVDRLYNNGMGGAPNHRYTTSTLVETQMIAQGWVSEGHVMCSPR